MNNLKYDYVKEKLGEDFLNLYVFPIINNESFKKQIFENKGHSLDLVYEDIGIDFTFVEEKKYYDLESIFFHFNNREDGYTSYEGTPFNLSNKNSAEDVHFSFGTPFKINNGNTKIGLNKSEIYRMNGFNLVFEYTEKLLIKTFSVQTKFNRNMPTRSSKSE